MSVSRLAPWLLAALALVLAAGTLLFTRASRSQLDLLRIERDLATVSERLMRTEMNERTLLAERMINDLIAESRRADLATLQFALLEPARPNAGSAPGILLWTTAPQRATLRVDSLPVLPAANDYQLWQQATPADDATSLGTFKPDQDGRVGWSLPGEPALRGQAEFFVTIEPAGGAARPTGPLVLRRVR